jgi:hypothetical protein
MSLSPSLLPRTAVTQGTRDRDQRRDRLRARGPRRVDRPGVRRPGAAPPTHDALAGARRAAAVTLLPMLVLARVWQNEVRDLMGARTRRCGASCWCRSWPAWCSPRSSVSAAAAGGVVGLAWLARWMGRACRPRAGAIVVTASWCSWSRACSSTGSSRSPTGLRDPGHRHPRRRHAADHRLRSGGPGSLIAWDTLGRQGRGFTGRGPTAADIAAFRGGRPRSRSAPTPGSPPPPTPRNGPGSPSTTSNGPAGSTAPTCS